MTKRASKARLAAVEALLAKADRTDTACVPASRLRAALSATAPDAGQREARATYEALRVGAEEAWLHSPAIADMGQREAQERAEVLRAPEREALRWLLGLLDAGGLGGTEAEDVSVGLVCRALARLDARADRSPEQP